MHFESWGQPPLVSWSWTDCRIFDARPHSRDLFDCFECKTKKMNPFFSDWSRQRFALLCTLPLHRIPTSCYLFHSFCLTRPGSGAQLFILVWYVSCACSFVHYVCSPPDVTSMDARRSALYLLRLRSVLFLPQDTTQAMPFLHKILIPLFFSLHIHSLLHPWHPPCMYIEANGWRMGLGISWFLRLLLGFALFYVTLYTDTPSTQTYIYTRRDSGRERQRGWLSFGIFIFYYIFATWSSWRLGGLFVDGCLAISSRLCSLSV